jgi:DnaJ-class molecular chaperone
VTPPDDEQPAAETGQAAEPVECSACRGTGKVISRLGGEEQQVDCPWCEGGGTRLREHNAQEHSRGEGGDGGGDGPPDLVA